jgi:regulator of protease activity HflC (stomatin/prohibitin superfamily)
MIRVAQRGFARKERLDGNTMNAGLINLGFAVFVREKYAVLVHRLQKFNRVMKPGLNFKIPIVDTIEYVHDLRE